MDANDFKSNFSQLRLLLWKNFALQKRSLIGLFLELLLPAFFAIILLPIRSIVKSNDRLNDTLYSPFSVDELPKGLYPKYGRHMYGDNSWCLGYAPNNLSIVDAIMNQTSEKFGFRLFPFATENEMVDYVTNQSNSQGCLGGISFLEANGAKFTYKIRLSYSPRNDPSNAFVKTDTDWKTNLIYTLFPILGPREKEDNNGGGPGYFREGFLALQKSIDFAIINQFTENTTDLSSVNLTLLRFPFPPYNDDNFVIIIAALFPFIIMLSFVFTIILSAKAIAYEKETGIKEAMKLMGMKTWIYWLSWYIKTFLLVLPAIIFMCISFKVKIPLTNGGTGYAAILEKTEWSILAVFFLLYMSSSITFMFFTTTLFKKANSAAAGAGIIWFFSYLPYIFISLRYEQMNLFEKLLAAFVNNLGMSEAVQLIGMFEGKGVGLHWYNINESISVDDTFTFLQVAIILFLNTFIHLLLTFYVEQINPGDHGIAKPWYFPVYYLFPKIEEKYLLNITNENYENKKNGSNSQVFIESEASYTSKIGIKIDYLSKVFKQFGKLKYAVKDLSLNIYENHITVLLGHNGAGKSTTISMITGILSPTNGSIYVNGYSIVNDTKKARSTLGYCPQHNLLFDNLTVYEHLVFYSKLKESFNEDEIDDMLNELNIADKKHALAKTLSGGMKRKLSVAIAFIGGSKIVILDEPTSGMDPQARHSTWSLLQKFKKEKKCTILLTTHFMDEADYLGDRIAIMSRGRLCCCGSPLYLKTKYGSGYNLILTRQLSDNSHVASPMYNTTNEENERVTSKITELIRKHVKDAMLNSNINSELTYILPKEDCSKFPGVLIELEQHKNELGIINIGVSVTTVEDVFLKIADIENCDDLNESTNILQHPAYNKSISVGSASINVEHYEIDQGNEDDDKTLGLWIGSSEVDRIDAKPRVILNSTSSYFRYAFLLFIQKSYFFYYQFKALLIKHIIHTLRNKVLVISQLIVPIGMLLIVLLYLKYAPIKVEDSPPLYLNLTRYSQNYVPSKVFYNETTDSIIDLGKLEKIYDTVVNKFENSKSFDLNDNKTVNLCSASRYSIEEFLICLGRLSINYITDTYLTAASFSFNNETNKVDIIGHFNNQPYHLPPLALNLLTNSLFNYFGQTANARISVINHPLPRNLKEQINDLQTKNPEGFNIATNITFGFSFLIASFALFLIKERVTGSKHIQYLSGANTFIFWLSALVWNTINYMLTSFLCIILIWSFGIDQFIDGGRVQYTIGLFLLYGLAHIPQTYLISYLFKVPATGFAAIVAWNLLSSQATLTADGILLLPQLGLVNISDLLEWIFLTIFPNFAFGAALNDLYNNNEFNKACEIGVKLCEIYPNPCCIGKKGPNPCGQNDCISWTPNYMAWERPGLLRFFVFLPLQFVIQFSLILLYEAGYLRQIGYLIKRLFSFILRLIRLLLRFERYDRMTEEPTHLDFDKDDDVLEEEQRIRQLSFNINQPTNDLLVIDNLTKYYSNFMAVRGISFGVKSNECFGLLGVNGAGKTSTFKMLTGDEAITSGTAYLNHINIKNNLKEFQRQIGYCPQFDPLIEQMTCMETLVMFSRLRSIKEPLIVPTCESLIKLLDLSDHQHKMCMTLSGGNKRKLSVAISLIGSPVIVFLDEPTSGMDPRTRRFLWDALNKIRSKGKSLILTTHSMDETEALCTQIGIMVNGEMKCLGNLQHLKNKYGDGYTLLLKLTKTETNNEERIENCIRFILDKFDNSTLKENREGFINIQINDNSIKILANIFSLIEEVKEKYMIEYYVVTQTKLEQIFLNFASRQIDPDSRFLHKSCFGF